MDPQNQFDAIIVITSIVELVLESTTVAEVKNGHAVSNGGSKKILTIFRGFRMFRVFKLAKKWKSFNRMINKISNSFGDIVTFLILLLIVASVFSLLGNEIFAYKVLLDKNGNIIKKPSNLNNPTELDNWLKTGFAPRPSFNNFLEASLTVFIVLIGEDW